MTLLALLHRWTGGVAGLALAILALSGTALLWEDKWILLDGANAPASGDPAALAQAVEVALAAAPDLSRITFAGAEIGLHQAIYADGSGAYIAQNGALADRWTGMWERPELWLFDLHHYLLLGEAGKTVTGALGLLLVTFTITGAILWWRTRKTFRFRLWPARYTRGAILRHHRDLGIVASPLLLILALTGALMVFPSLSAAVLSPFASDRAAPPLPSDLAAPDGETDWQRVMAQAQAVYPDARARRLMMPREPGAPIAIRFRQDFEWTPNGRSYVWVDPRSGAVVQIDDAGQSDLAAAITEKLYPLHAGKVGGLAWRIALSFAGFALVLLGLLASWSFWTGGARPKTAPAARRR